MKTSGRNTVGTLVSFGDGVEFREYLAGRLDAKIYADTSGERMEQEFALVRPPAPATASDAPGVAQAPATKS